MAKKIKKHYSFLALLLIGLLVRLFFSRYEIDGGDLLVFAEWGKRFRELGASNFYTKEGWYYSFPTYPPISSLLFGGIYWIFGHNYILAQIHNAVKIIPSSFIVYVNELFGNPLAFRKGYMVLIKLPSILADIFMSLTVFLIVKDITDDSKKARLASYFYLFNPVTIFLSSIWGQTESLVSLFGILAFYLLSKERVVLSLPLLFISLYLKPTFAIFIPLFTIILFYQKPEVKKVAIGLFLSLAIFVVTTIPFSGPDVVAFIKTVLLENILPAAKGTARASVSAINFYTAFLVIDRAVATKALSYFGYSVFVALNIYSAFFLKKREKNLKKRIFVSLFLVGFGSFLFLTNMLERYFFPAFVPLVVLMFIDKKYLLSGLFINLISFINLFWMYFRRTSYELHDIFVYKNYALVKILSVLIVYFWFRIAVKTSFFSEFNKFLKRNLASVKI